MNDIQIINAEKRHFSDVLNLNENLVQFLSPMDMKLCEQLFENAKYFWVIEQNGVVQACLIALDKGKEYESVNYKWFSDRYDNFIYIDRVIVSEDCQGKGYGKFIYKRIFEKAKNDGYKFIAAEINIKPINTPSLSFHQMCGFKQVGAQLINDGEKEVSMQIKKL